MKSSLFLAVFVVGCSKSSAPATPPQASPSASSASTSALASARVDAAAPRATCAEPDRLVQLGTLKEQVHFQDEVLVGEHDAFDPETLQAIARPSTTPKPRAVTPSRYKALVAGKGLIWDDSDHATVEDASSHKVILTAPVCSAGGAIDFDFSATGRFLICISSRAGLVLWDLSVPHPTADKPLAWGKDMTQDPGLVLAPTDAYAIVVPMLGWGTELPTRPSIEWFDLNAHVQKSLGSAPVAVPDAQGNLPNPSLPFGVAFCGDGVLFAVAESKELVVYRGSDAFKLASAPAMQGGAVSFSASGKYLSQTRAHATTVFRLDP